MLVVPELLVVENFQSLRDRVEIPLRRLTLLYGPNSSGKSAVLDALVMIRHVLTGTEEEIRSMSQRWCHRSQKESGSQLAMQLRLEAIVAVNIADDDSSRVGLDLVGQLPSALDKCKDFGFLRDDLCHRVAIAITVPPGKTDSITFEVDVDEKPALRVERNDALDDYSAELWPSGFGEALFTLADAYNVDKKHVNAFRVDSQVDLNPLRLRRAHWLSGEFHDYESLLLRFANFLISRMAELLPDPKVVPGDRGLIDDGDLTFTGCSGGLDRGLWSSHLGLPTDFTAAPQTERRVPFHKAPLFGQLALSWLHSHANDIFRGRPWPPEERESRDEPKDLIDKIVDAMITITFSRGTGLGKGRLHEYVNDCLNRHLFLDQGYALRFDLCEIRPAKGSPVSGTVWSDRWFQSETVGGDLRLSGIVNIWLADSQGRAVRFRDVGSGLSCVMPVLGALWTDFSFIQQPELHLHPALQGALADVVIESIGSAPTLPPPGAPTSSVDDWGPSCHILETHSESLLLRCLRRMRQTAGGRKSDLRLSPEQIAVLYFDPQPDGCTRVKRIRLTPDGEFVDRWPRGFFEERAMDLFDE